MSKEQEIINTGLSVLSQEAEAIYNLKSKIDNVFYNTCQAILNCKGRVIVTGMGKSGHIANKIAATFASTGTLAHFLHPAEASHGDLGVIAKDDIVLALSNSGQTGELLAILPLIKRLNVKLISFTGNPESELAKLSDFHIPIIIESEACSLGLAPTSSTTAALAMGDAIAVSVLKARGFTSDDFARTHPGGKLGKRLLVKIKDIMHTGDNIPIVSSLATLSESIIEISNKRLGMTTVVDNISNNLIGIFTDGDLRRILNNKPDINNINILDVMTTKFKTINYNKLASEAVSIMQSKQIFALPVVDDDNKLIGAFNMHDLLQAGVV